MAKHRICHRCAVMTPGDGPCSTCGGSATPRASDRPEWREVYGTREWRRLRRRILDRDGYACVNCGHQGDGDNELQVDHVVPLSRGGAPFAEENLATRCRRCNLARRSRPRAASGIR